MTSSSDFGQRLTPVNAATLVAGFSWTLAVGGPLVLLAALTLDTSWTRELHFVLLMVMVTVGMRTLTVPLGKYSYVSPGGIVSLTGAVLVGIGPTLLAVAGGTALADWAIQRKGRWAVLVNASREVVGLAAAYGVFAAALLVAGEVSPLSWNGASAVGLFVFSFFAASRSLFYFTLAARGKLGPEEQRLILRYEIVTAAILVVASMVIVVTVVALPPLGWPFVLATLAFVGVMAKQIAEEAVQAEELNKLHAMDAVITGTAGLDDALARIEGLADRTLGLDHVSHLRIPRPAIRGALSGYPAALGRRAARGPPSTARRSGQHRPARRGGRHVPRCPDAGLSRGHENGGGHAAPARRRDDRDAGG